MEGSLTSLLGSLATEPPLPWPLVFCLTLTLCWFHPWMLGEVPRQWPAELPFCT